MLIHLKTTSHHDTTNLENKEFQKGIDLYGMYNENDLLIQELEEDYQDKKITIPQITGLKNEVVQNQINSEMREQIYKTLGEIKSLEDMFITIHSNFANVLSLSCTFYEEDWQDSTTLYFNYELQTGRHLRFEDLLIKKEDMITMVQKGFYDSMMNFSYINDETGESLAYVDEYELYKATKGFMEKEDKEFTFTPAGISFYYGNTYGNVDFVNVADKIAIYYRFLTKESLFIDNHVGRKNIPTCVNTNAYKNMFENIQYGYLESNYWYDVTIWKNNFIGNEMEPETLKKFQHFQEKFYKIIYSYVEEYRTTAKQHPDTFYIVLCKPSTSIITFPEWTNNEWKNTYLDMVSSTKSILIYEMSKNVYEEIYKDKLIQAYRYKYFAMGGGIFLDTSKDERVKVTQISDNKLYNLLTGEELTSLQDIFREDSHYLEVLKEKVKNILSYWEDYANADLGKLANSAEYVIQGEYIEVIIPEIKETSEYGISIYLSELDKHMFKLFHDENT